MEDPQKLKDLLAFAMGQKSQAQAAGPDMAAFNNAYVQAQAQSPSFLPATKPTPNPEDAVNREIEAQGRKSLEAQQGELNRQRELANKQADSAIKYWEKNIYGKL